MILFFQNDLGVESHWTNVSHMSIPEQSMWQKHRTLWWAAPCSWRVMSITPMPQEVMVDCGWFCKVKVRRCYPKEGEIDPRRAKQSMLTSLSDNTFQVPPVRISSVYLPSR